MENVLRYIWLDDEGNENISKEPPLNLCRSAFGGFYTPEYKKVLLIPIKDE